MALPKRPNQGNFMNHLAPGNIDGTGIKSVQQEFHQIEARRNEEMERDGSLYPMSMDMKDYDVESRFRKRLQRGGSSFNKKDILVGS